MLTALAYLSLTVLFVGHWRELVIMDNYARTEPRSMWFFAADPLIMIFAAFALREVLWASPLGIVAYIALIAEILLHVVVYTVHFTRKPLSTAASTVHNIADSLVMGAVLLLTARALPAELAVGLSLLAVPVAMISVSAIKWGLGLDQPAAEQAHA